MPANPDRIGDLATRAVEADDFMQEALSDLPGESTISTDDLAAHFIMMDYEQRYQLFHELIITHSSDGIRLAKEIYNKAAVMLAGDQE